MKVEKIKETQYFKELYQSEIPDDAYAVMTDYEEDGICREEDLPVFGSDVTFSGKEGAETFKQVAEELNEQYADGWQVLSALVDPNYNGDTLALYVANELKDLARDNQHQSQSRKEIMGRLNQFFKLAAQDLQGLVDFTEHCKSEKTIVYVEIYRWPARPGDYNENPGRMEGDPFGEGEIEDVVAELSEEDDRLPLTEDRWLFDENREDPDISGKPPKTLALQYVDTEAIDRHIREIERVHAYGSETALWQDYCDAKLKGLSAEDALWWRNAYQAYEDAEGKIGEDLQASYDSVD